MFKKLFKYRAVILRHQRGPNRKERENFLADCAAKGMAHLTLQGTAQELLIIAREIAPVFRNGLNASEVAQIADRRSAVSNLGPYARTSFIQVATDWLQFCGKYHEIPQRLQPYAPLMQEFARFQLEECGLSEITIAGRAWQIQRFLNWLIDRNCPFAAVRVEDVDSYLHEQRDKWSRVSMASAAKALRSFFRFAEQQAWCVSGIHQVIESPRIFQQEGLPAGPCWEDVQHLLVSKQGDQPRNIRDRAILLLFALYGLRRSEVASLTLDHIDWVHDCLTIWRSKQRRTTTYPLHPTVGTALIRYLQEIRPSSKYREVFLTLKAPIHPISPAGLSTMTVAALITLGIRSPHYGPHALRHACATHLLTEGFSLKEIGDHLGHRHPSTTRIYAKVDMVGLREVADFDCGGLL